MNSTFKLLALGLISASLMACNDSNHSDATDPSTDSNTQTAPRDLTVNFKAAVGESTFTCGETYAIGTSQKLTQINDFRAYISNVQMVKPDGSKEAVALTEDGKWQNQNVALLDFENGCESGNADLNSSITGTVADSDYSGICFDLGVPFELNHLDNASAPSPLNASGMFWSWQGGYKFLRIDMKGDPGDNETFANQGFVIHLGSTGCTSDSRTTAPTESCANVNRPTYCMDFNADNDTLVLDAASLFAESDTTINTADTAPGCMSGNADPECDVLLPRLGLDFAYADGSGAEPVVFPAVDQRLVRVETTH